MTMYDATDANNVLAANLGIATYPSVPGTKIRLGSPAVTPNSTTNMTEITGSGYTAGGAAISWTAPSGQSTSNSAAVSWTNTSGSSWSISYLEIWDTNGTPKRHYFGQWSGTIPIVVSSGNIFQVNIGNVTAALV